MHTRSLRSGGVQPQQSGVSSAPESVVTAGRAVEGKQRRGKRPAGGVLFCDRRVDSTTFTIDI